ncbi:39S ribosomal protein L10, mitochondrial-like [Asterias rubens]|uniref:39S ribosomal protein L10, mitochondrial-like n=1 Tax=Asterias rubens TaxID=7604 RepID=UPI001455D599|nr:39S ribosomal protein L10, mitochondrial-like [Asterias rubens]
MGLNEIMASNICGNCLSKLVPTWSPFLMQVRGMKSVNTRVKRPMHITRAKLMELTKYKRPKDLRSMAEQCSMRYKGERIQEENPVQTFMAKQCREQLTNKPFIAVFNREGLGMDELSALRRRLKKADISIKLYGNDVTREAFLGTKLENMMPLFVGENIYAVGEKPAVKELLKATKKLDKLQLLGGLVDNRLMSAKQMKDYSKLPDIGTLQGQLAGILSQSVGSTYNLLQRNQEALVANLGQWMKQREGTSV